MKKLVLSLLALLLLTATAFAFSDVPEGHWAYNAVNAVSERGLAEGYPDGTFKPSGTLTRAEFLTMCVRAAYGEETVKENEGKWQPIPDYAAGHWCKPYYDLAQGRNWKVLYLGDADRGDTQLDGGITRGEISLLLRSAHGEMRFGFPPVRQGEFAFTDGQVMYDRIGPASAFSQKHWSRYYDTEWAVQQGLIAGYPDGSFRPDNTLTRAEAAAVLYRLTVQNDIWKENGRIVTMTDDYVIYCRSAKEDMTVISESLPERTELGRISMPRIGTVAEEFDAWVQATGFCDILNANGKYFWGNAGFFEYYEDGTFRQLTDTPVIDYGYDASDGSFVFVSHAPGDGDTITSGGITKSAGNMVLRLTADGQKQTLLTKQALRQLPAAPDGTPWVSLVKVHYATGGEVRVIGEYNWGMADLHRFVLEVKDGAVKYVPMGAGDGYSY